MLPPQGGYHASYWRRWDTSCLEAREHGTILRRYSGRRRDYSGRPDDNFSNKKLSIVFPVVQELLRCHLSHIPRISRRRHNPHCVFFVSITETLDTRDRDIRISHRRHMGLRCDKTVRLSRNTLPKETHLTTVSSHISRIRTVPASHAFRIN